MPIKGLEEGDDNHKPSRRHSAHFLTFSMLHHSCCRIHTLSCKGSAHWRVVGCWGVLAAIHTTIDQSRVVVACAGGLQVHFRCYQHQRITAYAPAALVWIARLCFCMRLLRWNGICSGSGLCCVGVVSWVGVICCYMHAMHGLRMLQVLNRA